MMDYPMDHTADLVVETGCAVRYGIEANAALIHQLILRHRIVIPAAELAVKELSLRRDMETLYITKPPSTDEPITVAHQARMLFEKYGPYLESQLEERNLDLTPEQLSQLELRILNLVNTILDDFR